MENLLSVQHQLIEAMQKLFTNFKKDGAERKTSSHIKRRLDTLDQYWREFQDNHIKLCEYENQDYSYFSEKTYERTSALYSEYRRAIQQCLPAEQEAKSILRPATPLAGGSMDWLPPATPGISEQHLPSTGNQNQPLPTPSKVERGNQSRLGEMYKKQKSNFKALDRAISNINLELLTERWEFEDALQSLQSRWNAVDNLHWEIDSELITEDARYEETYYMYEESYTKIKKSINSKMWAVSHREKITPKMEIPIFSGSYQQWTSFKDLFSEMIHKNTSISKAQKMQFLKSKVKGEAEKLIQHLHISSDNYDTCWDILNHRYNNKRLIFSSHMSILLSIPTMSIQSSSSLKKLHDTTKECLNAVKNLGVDISNWDPLVVHLLVQKLDADTHNDYFEYLKDPRELPTISDFLSFLEMRFTALESSRRKQEAPRNIIQQHQDFKKAYNFKANPGASTKALINHTSLRFKISCPLCNEQHGIFHCKTFLNQSAEMKRKTVSRLKICENCLFDHKGKACFSDKRCNQCNAEHNTLLHEAYVANNKVGAPISTGKIAQQKNVTHVAQDCVAEILLATAQIKVLSSDGSYITMRALIDQGSQTSLISENAAQILGLPRERCKGVVFGIGTKENSCKGVINITASALHSDYTFSTEAIIMKNLVNNLPNRSFDKPSWKHLEGIQLGDPDFNISRPIDILLGAHIYSKIILSGIIREDQNQPIIQQSRLGWIICGGLKSYQCNVVLHEVDDISRLKDVPESTHSISSEDQYCLDLYQKTTERQEDGRYVVCQPLKPDFKEKLGDSKQKAVAQLHQLEKKFVKDEEISKLYKQFMREYYELGHMETFDRNSNMTPSCYLPHHCVRRAESTTAAHLLSRLMRTVQRSLSHQNLKIFGWSDSTAVLGWIQGDITRWKPFVANRVQEIKDVIPSDSCRYVKSADNPADCASRGIYAANLRDHPLWWQGPAWLKTYQKENTVKTYTTNQEVKKSLQSNVTTQRHNDDIIGDLLSRHSNMTRVTRILTWVRRAVSRCKPLTPYLTASEIKQSRIIIIKYVQHINYQDEILTIKQKKSLKSDSKLLPLNPFIDKQDLLRVGGRINHANINEDMKHPLIIPHSGPLTNLLIDHAHKSTFHGGARLTLSWLRQHYWIIGGNRAVKKRLRDCVVCRKHNPIMQTQIMGDLPSARCNPTRPFYHTGVDFTGHIEVKSNKGRGIKTTKGYVAVFVCMVTKATHLELVSDLSSSAFLAALRRLAARRGAPCHMYSDNGTNFIGASRHLKEEFVNLKHTLDDEFFSAIADMNIEWHFNAPLWPSAGGLWEAAVKSLKFHLRRVIGAQKLTYEELATLLSQLEGCLNSRPLCALSEDPEDINYLTPSHFLSSGPTLTIIETEKDERTRWQLVQKIFNDTWKRWQSEYLCQLSARSKWHKKQENPAIGDIVVIHDAHLPPGKWALGRIVELHPGKDDFIRVVSIKTKNTIIRRPITKISSLVPNKDLESKSKEEKNSEPQNKQSKAEGVKTRRARGNKKCNFVALAMMLLFCIVISPAQCAYSLLSLNSSQSIYLDKISNMHLVRDQWKLIVYYDMDPYWQGLNLFGKYIKNLENLCNKGDKQTKCDIVLLQLHHEATELEYYNNILLGQRLTRTRRRRGLINGVGYLAHTLFGVLDDDFAQQYERDINLIRQNQKHLTLLWKNQTSIVEAEHNLLSRIEESMNKQHKIFNQHIIDLEKASNTLAKEVQNIKVTDEFMLSSMIATSILANLKNIQETLVDTITNINYGKFNVHLLTPNQLREELNIISGQLSKELALPIDNIQTNLPSIYHLLKVKARMTNQYFIFEIKVPLVSRDSFEIYKLIAVPQQTQEGMACITPISDHLAINIQKDSYIPLSEEEVRRCVLYDTETHLCPLQKPIFHLNSDESLCIRNQAVNQCEIYTSTCKDTWVELNRLNTYLYFCCDQCTIRVICGHQVSGQKLSKAGIITLGDGCVVKNEAFTILTHRQQVTNLNIMPDLGKIDIPPINDVINLTISIPKIENLDLTNHEEHRKRISQIGQQIEHMKDDADVVLADQMSTHDLHQFIVVYLLLGAVAIAATFYVWRRLRLRCTARLQQAAPQDRSVGLNVHFTSPGPSTEQSRPEAPHKRDRSAAAAAGVLDKSTSPVIRTRFSECV